MKNKHNIFRGLRVKPAMTQNAVRRCLRITPRFIWGTMLLFLSLPLVAQNTLQIGAYSTAPDTELEISLLLNNAAPFAAFQADIPIPSGFAYIANSAELNAARANGHSFSAAVVSGNVLRLIAFSVSNQTFNGTSGAIAVFRLQSAVHSGDFPLEIQNAAIGNSSGTNILTGVSNGNVTVLSPEIELSAASLDYSRVALQSASNRSFVIQNTGNSTLTVSSLSFTNAEFSTSETLPFNIAAGVNKTVTVTFAPLVKGAKTAQLIIGSNDYDEPTVTVDFQAVAYAVNELHTGNFGGASGTTQTLAFSINNMENFTGFQFDLKLPAAMTYVANSATLFRANGHSAAVNQHNDTLRVVAFSFSNDNFTGGSGQILSLDFALDGIAGNYPLNISNVIIVDNQSENILSDKYNGTLNITSPDIHAAASLDFGEVSILETKEMPLTIYNYGQETLIVNQLRFFDTHFSTTENLPFNVEAGQSKDLFITFAPTTKDAVTTQLNLSNNDPDEPVFEVALSGSAFVPNVLKIVADTLKTSEAAVEIEIENYENFVAFQFDLTFPAGVVPDLQNVALTADRKQNHSVSASAVSANTLRVVAFSLTQQNFLGNSGAIVKIPFTTNCGNYNFSLSNVLISNSLSENILQTSENGAVEIEQDTVTIYAAVCYGDVYTANGFSLPAQTESGVYLLDLQTANGCDSIVKLDLTVSINETVAAFASQIAALQNQVAALKADTVVYLSQISGLQTDTTALHSQISGLQTDTIALHSQIAVLTDNLNDCNENTTLLQNQVIALQTDTTAYLAQIALLQNQIIALKIDTTAYLAQIASLNTQITNLNTQITALQTDTAAYLAQIASLNTQITNLNTQITALQTDTAAYLAQIAGLNTQVATLQTQITSLNGQITNLQNDLGDCNSEKTALVNQITNLNTEISTLENQVLILENDLTDCNNEKTVLISDLQICTENAVILNEKIDSLQNELDNCKNQLGIEEIPAFEVQIYPNPATDELRIKSVDCQINSVEIFDISGRAVGAGRALPLQNGGQTINVSSLPAGVYLIKINTDKGTKTERFIKK